MLPDNILLWFPTLLFLAYCPVLCYLDWKYHDIRTHAIWPPLIGLNLPFLIIGYWTGLYPQVLALISFISVILWFIIMKKGILPGADFVWLSLISLFMVLNPISGRPFMLMFSFYLIGMTAVTIFGITLDKRLRHEKISLHMVLDFPYMIPICAALVMAVVTG